MAGDRRGAGPARAAASNCSPDAAAVVAAQAGDGEVVERVGVLRVQRAARPRRRRSPRPWRSCSNSTSPSVEWVSASSGSSVDGVARRGHRARLVAGRLQRARRARCGWSPPPARAGRPRARPRGPRPCGRAGSARSPAAGGPTPARGRASTAASAASSAPLGVVELELGERDQAVQLGDLGRGGDARPRGARAPPAGRCRSSSASCALDAPLRVCVTGACASGCRPAGRRTGRRRWRRARSCGRSPNHAFVDGPVSLRGLLELALGDRVHGRRADRLLQRQLGGGLDDVHEVRAAAAVGAAGELGRRRPPSIGRSSSALRRIASRAGWSGGSTSTRAVQPARAAAARCRRPTDGWSRRARRRPRCRACAPSSSASSWLTTLRPAVVAQVAALLAERVELVEEEHARRGAARRLERVVELALGLAEPHVEHVAEAEREEARAQLARDRAGEERLAAAGRAVEQQAAAQRLAVVGAQLGVAQRRQERGVQARLDLLEAADVVERDPRALRLDQALGVELGEAFGGISIAPPALRPRPSADRILGRGPPARPARGVVPLEAAQQRAYVALRARVSPSACAASRAAASASASSGAVGSAACACSSARSASPPITSSAARWMRSAGLPGRRRSPPPARRSLTGRRTRGGVTPRPVQLSLAIATQTAHTGSMPSQRPYSETPRLGRRTRACRGLPARARARRPPHHDELEERIGLAYAAVTRRRPRTPDRRPAPRRRAPPRAPPRRASAPRREEARVQRRDGPRGPRRPRDPDGVMAGVVVALAAVFALSVVRRPVRDRGADPHRRAAPPPPAVGRLAGARTYWLTRARHASGAVNRAQADKVAPRVPGWRVAARCRG